jgi:hypothetical protein
MAERRIAIQMTLQSGNGRLSAAVGELGDGGGATRRRVSCFYAPAMPAAASLVMYYFLICILANGVPAYISVGADRSLLLKTEMQ